MAIGHIMIWTPLLLWYNAMVNRRTEWKKSVMQWRGSVLWTIRQTVHSGIPITTEHTPDKVFQGPHGPRISGWGLNIIERFRKGINESWAIFAMYYLRNQLGPCPSRGALVRGVGRLSILTIKCKINRVHCIKQLPTIFKHYGKIQKGHQWILSNVCHTLFILLCVTFPGAPSYGGVRTWVEGFQARGNGVGWSLKPITNLLPTNNAQHIHLINTD